MSNFNCLECLNVLNENEDTCPKCGWTYKVVIKDESQIYENAVPVCLKCFSEYGIEDHYCKNCGNVVGKYTAYQPFEGIKFSYSIHQTLWKRVWHDETTSMTKRILNLLILLCIAPIFTLFIPIEILKKKFKKRKS